MCQDPEAGGRRGFATATWADINAITSGTGKDGEDSLRLLLDDVCMGTSGERARMIEAGTSSSGGCCDASGKYKTVAYLGKGDPEQSTFGSLQKIGFQDQSALMLGNKMAGTEKFVLCYNPAGGNAKKQCGSTPSPPGPGPKPGPGPGPEPGPELPPPPALPKPPPPSKPFPPIDAPPPAPVQPPPEPEPPKPITAPPPPDPAKPPPEPEPPKPKPKPKPITAPPPPPKKTPTSPPPPPPTPPPPSPPPNPPPPSP